MSFDEELSEFKRTHIYQKITVSGIAANYLLCGNERSVATLVYLVGGTGFSAVWFNHIKRMETEYRILTFEYPMEINDIEELADFVWQLIDTLKIENPVFIGASLGGFLGQLIARKSPEKTAGLALYSTCGLSAESIKGLKKQYRSYGFLLAIMKIVPYDWIRGLLIKTSVKMVGIEVETPDARRYMEDFFKWVYKNYTKKFDIHMTTLMASVPKLRPVSDAEYRRFDEKSLLVLPINDKAFPESAQKQLLDAMPRSAVTRIKGGHTAVLYDVAEYVDNTKVFLNKILKERKL